MISLWAVLGCCYFSFYCPFMWLSKAVRRHSFASVLTHYPGPSFYTCTTSVIDMFSLASLGCSFVVVLLGNSLPMSLVSFSSTRPIQPHSQPIISTIFSPAATSGPEPSESTALFKPQLWSGRVKYHRLIYKLYPALLVFLGIAARFC
ncbi:hypothetical protein BCR34DRAFT_177891 [Clohesyomyces aquaticus]|uniref:Uncharacterized protein n=1 Tax=Clohesyomyces aquaticus TaxID=1231657 RepID=A0A1Y1ZYX3_9PLEO|nr:hypothetical protein BCR34DRAFT_177891 [Clohesyomyces aquaticus]